MTTATKKAFRVSYTDTDDDGCPVFSYVTQAWNREHAEIKFYEGTDADDWKIVSIERVKP